jgi:VWFA-related protein
MQWVLPANAVRVGAVVIACSALICPLLQAQESTVGVFFEPLEVPLVSFEVYVFDREGRPIPGLTVNDFEVYEDGDRVEISHFFASEGVVTDPTAAAAGSQLGSEESPSQRLFLVVYVDETNLRIGRRKLILENLRDFFTQDFPGDLQVMLVSYDGALQVKQPLSADRSTLLTALDELKRDASISSHMVKSRIMREIQRYGNKQLSLEMVQPQGGASMGAFADPMEHIIMARSLLRDVESYAQERRHRTLANLETMRHFVRSLSGLPGRKAIMYVSDGIELRPGEDLFRLWQYAYTQLALDEGMTPSINSRRYSVSSDMRKLVEYANAYRVSFYTLSSLADQIVQSTSAASAGIEGTSGIEILPWTSEEAFIQMTSGTGGRSLANNDKLAEHLDEVAEELSSYYSLGYRPPHEQDDRYHRIRVKVNRDKARVRHRSGYRSKSNAELMADRTLSAAIHGVTDNPLEVSLDTLDEVARDDGNYTVRLLIKVPLKQIVLLPQQAIHQGQISVFVVVRDFQGGISSVTRREYPLEIPNEHYLAAVSRDAGFALGLAMREGEQVIAVGIRDELGNVESTATLDINVGGSIEDSGRTRT